MLETISVHRESYSPRYLLQRGKEALPNATEKNLIFPLLANSEKANNIFIVCLLICSLKEAKESVNQKNFHLKNCFGSQWLVI